MTTKEALSYVLNFADNQIDPDLPQQYKAIDRIDNERLVKAMNILSELYDSLHD